MKTLVFHAQALTPVHVGSGVEIDPLEFFLRDRVLFRFSPTKVIDALPENERERLVGLIDQGNLRGIQNFLRAHLREEQTECKIGASEKFCREFEQKAAAPDRRFRVDMMPRNPVTQEVFLPGSSIKGAIRTAVINYFTNDDEKVSGYVHQRVLNAQGSRKGRVLEEAALGRERKETEKDLFRMIHVEDAVLPLGSTRIDRAFNWNPIKRGSEKIQMWVERILACVDAFNAPKFKLKIHIDTEKMNDPSVRRILGRTLEVQKIFQACNRFYWNRMLAEADKFYGRNQGSASRDDSTWKAIHRSFPRARLKEGKPFILDPGTPGYWCAKNQPRRRILLRLGRFSHFESLSVDELRRGWNAQARKPIQGMGSTRTLCAMENEKPPMPFGWIILTTEDTF